MIAIGKIQKPANFYAWANLHIKLNILNFHLYTITLKNKAAAGFKAFAGALLIVLFLIFVLS